MHLDAQDRVLSLSFERNPKEHVDAMIAAGRRLVRPRRKLPRSVTFVGSIIIGIAIGMSMDFYRKLVLEPVFGVDAVAPLGIVLLQILPIIIMLAVLYYIFCIRAVKRRRQALIDRMEPGKFVDVDIFKEGLRTSYGLITTMFDWRAVNDIVVRQDRIEFDFDTSISYIPARAFKSRAEFEAAAQQTRRLWAEAKNRSPTEEVRTSHDRTSEK